MRRFLTLIFLILAGTFTFFTHSKKQPEPPRINRPDSLAGAPRGPYVTVPDNPHWVALLSEFEGYLANALRRNLAPGVAVAVVQDTSVLLMKGLGLRDAQYQDSVDIFSVFRLGSVSKPFASVLTGVLVKEGLLNWDDPVRCHLPSFRLKTDESSDSVTLRHLLSHTTGLPYHAYTDRVDDGANMDTLIYHLRNVNLIGKPGQFYSYQNVAYSVIGEVIQAVTNKPFDVVMMEKVFAPLKMGQASMDFQSIATDDNRARPHVFTRRNGWIAKHISPTYYNAGPAGGANASISDMAQWMRALTTADSSFLDETTKEEVFGPNVRAIARNRNFRRWKKSKGSYYALGWRVLTFKDDTLHYHGGYVNGYRSEVAIKRDEKIAVCILVNAAGSLADQAVPEFFRLYEKHRLLIDQWNKRDTTVFASGRL